MRTCSKCGIEKPNSEFYANQRSNKCKECRREYSRNHPTPNNPQNMKDWINNMTPEQKKMFRRANHLRDKYGISLRDYDEMLAKQNGVCATCHRPPAPDKVLVVDHCHETGSIRGLLCNYCNLALGFASDDVEVLKNMVDYIVISRGSNTVHGTSH